jgi:hypothetical protein
MGDRRPVGEIEFNPLGDAADLISQVTVREKPRTEVVEEPAPQETVVAPTTQKVVKLKAQQAAKEPLAGKKKQIEEDPLKDFVICKFKVPRSDYMAAKKIVAQLEDELNARIDLSNLGRGWLTRLITAEKEVIEAARHQEKLKTPNSRNPLEVAEVDHVMSVVQSVAFRRAEPVR